MLNNDLKTFCERIGDVFAPFTTYVTKTYAADGEERDTENDYSVSLPYDKGREDYSYDILDDKELVVRIWSTHDGSVSTISKYVMTIPKDCDCGTLSVEYNVNEGTLDFHMDKINDRTIGHTEKTIDTDNDKEIRFKVRDENGRVAEFNEGDLKRIVHDCIKHNLENGTAKFETGLIKGYIDKVMDEKCNAALKMEKKDDGTNYEVKCLEKANEQLREENEKLKNANKKLADKNTKLLERLKSIRNIANFKETK